MGLCQEQADKFHPRTSKQSLGARVESLSVNEWGESMALSYRKPGGEGP